MRLDNFNWNQLGRILIVIDAANIEHSAKDLKYHIRYKSLRDYFKERANVFQFRFYSARFASDSHERFLTFLKKHGFIIVTKALKLIQDQSRGEFRKADFDVEITADTIDRIKEFDALVLFSGDSDFDYLIRLLKARNKRVVVVSSKFHVSREVVDSCSFYFDIKKFRGIFLKQTKSPSFATGG